MLSYGYKNTVGAVAHLFFSDPPFAPHAIFTLFVILRALIIIYTMRQSKKLEKSFWVWHLNSPPVRKIYETSTFKIAPSSPQPRHHRHHRHHHHREYLTTKITEKDNADDDCQDEQYEGLIYWGPQLGNFGQQVLAFVSFIKSLLAKNLSHCQHHYHHHPHHQPSPQSKQNTIRDGGITALYTVVHC